MNITYQELNSSDYSFYLFDKKWDSIAQCCEYYGISYRSVMQYKSDYKCNTEKAIQKYIDYKKSHGFYFRKKKWSSMKECCDFYNINYKSFIECKRNWDLPPDEALKKYINMKKNRMFVFNGVTYNSFADCCHAHSVNPISVEEYGKKRNLMRRRALIGYLKYKDKINFTFGNRSYASFAECCRCYGVKSSTLREYAKRQEVSLYSALIHYILLDKAKPIAIEDVQEELFFSIKYKGIFYKTVVLCCEALSIDIELVCQNMQDKQIEQVIKEMDKKNIRMERKQDPLLFHSFCYQKIYYPSLGVCCKQLGLKENLVYSRLWRDGETIESVLDFYIRNSKHSV